MDKKRVAYLEIIRIIAVFLVIYNHTGYDGYLYFAEGPSAPAYLISIFLSVLCKIAVPLFFMVSGALLLGRQESIRVILKKRVLRIVIVIIIISLFYYLLEIGVGGQPFNPGEFFAFLFEGYVVNSLWFLYAYLAFLLMLPFLRKIATGMKGPEFLYLLLLKVILQGVLSTVGLLSGTTPNHLLNEAAMIADGVFYPLMGFYLANRLDEARLTRKNGWLAALVGVAGVVAGCLLIYGDYLARGSYGEYFHNTMIVFPAIAVFVIVRVLCRGKSFGKKSTWVLTLIGGCTFGIYLFEPLFRKLLYGVYLHLAPVLTPLGACVVWVLAVFGCGFVLTDLLKLIPGVKKLL